MFTPTFERTGRVLLAAVLFGLAGCETSGLGTAASRTTVNVAGDAITVIAPTGFCVDNKSTSVDRTGAFVLMSDCDLLSGQPASRTDIVGAALTASISNGGLGGEGDDPVQSLADLQEFVDTGEGKALLSRSGQSNGVRILSTMQHGDVLFVLVEDRGRQPIAGVEQQFWRAFLELGDRLVVLSVLEFEGAGVSSQDGLNLLSSLASSLQRANGA